MGYADPQTRGRAGHQDSRRACGLTPTPLLPLPVVRCSGVRAALYSCGLCTGLRTRQPARPFIANKCLNSSIVPWHVGDGGVPGARHCQLGLYSTAETGFNYRYWCRHASMAPSSSSSSTPLCTFPDPEPIPRIFPPNPQVLHRSHWPPHAATRPLDSRGSAAPSYLSRHSRQRRASTFPQT